MEPSAGKTESVGARWARRLELFAWFLLPIPVMILGLGTWLAFGFARYGAGAMAGVIGFALFAGMWAGSRWAERFEPGIGSGGWIRRLQLSVIPVAFGLLVIVGLLVLLYAAGD